MNNAIDNLNRALSYAMSRRPKKGGFPFIAEVLRSAGITRNMWCLPSCQSTYLTHLGPVVMPGSYVIQGMEMVPTFDQEALIRALRLDQAGEGTFPEFLQAAWNAGVVRYEVDFETRRVSYYGVFGDSYVEDYPAVDLK